MFADDDRPLGLRLSGAARVDEIESGEPVFDTLEGAAARALQAQRTGRHAIVVVTKPSQREPNSPIALWHGCRGFVQRRERRNRGTVEKPQIAIVAWHVVLDVVDVIEAAREKRERDAMPVKPVKISARRMTARFKAR